MYLLYLLLLILDDSFTQFTRSCIVVVVVVVAIYVGMVVYSPFIYKYDASSCDTFLGLNKHLFVPRKSCNTISKPTNYFVNKVSRFNLLYERKVTSFNILSNFPLTLETS